MTKLVYVAHQIAGNVTGNIRAVVEICKKIHTPDILPVAPYLESVYYLDDDKPEERELGQLLDKEFFKRKVIDELWLCGPRISNGMRDEIRLSLEHGIPIRCYNPELQPELERIMVQYNPQSATSNLLLTDPTG